MRKFKLGLITLAASAAVIVPAGSAVATSGGTSNATTASGALIEVKDIDTNVIVWTGDILSPSFGDVCVLNGNQVVALLSGVDQDCADDGHGHKKAHKK
jgi:hypothetical protein